MQIVKWGKKQRQVKVPVGWAFIKNGKEIRERDKYFNLATHAWDNVTEEDIGCDVGVDHVYGVFIREERRAESSELDRDPRAVRIIPEYFPKGPDSIVE